MKMESAKERREFFRVDGQVHLCYRKISEEEKRGILKRQQKRESLQNQETQRQRLGRADSEVSRFDDPELEELRERLQRVEEKLDLIIRETIPIYSEAEEWHFEPCFVNISGCGMRLPTRERFRKGDCLEIRILLPIMPNHPIRLLSEVIHVMETPERVYKLDEKHPYDTGVKFISLLEEDREQIVRYTFHQQANMLRELRCDQPS